MKWIGMTLYATLFLLTAVCLFGLAGGLSASLAAQEPTGTASPSVATRSESTRTDPVSEAAAASPSMAEKKPGISDREGILQALEDEDEDIIVVSSDIEWEGYDVIEVSRPVTILLGDYSLHVTEDSNLWIRGPVVIRGSGGGKPLIDVSGGLTANEGVKIVAEGEETTAVRAAGYLNLEGAEVTARGRGAAAVVYTRDDMVELYGAKIRAWGRLAVGVRCESPLVVMLCSIEAEGEAVAGTSDLTIDSSHISPVIDDAVIIRRVAVADDRMNENGVCIEVGSGLSVLEEIKESQNQLVYSLISADSEVIRQYTAEIFWTELPSDLAKTGTFYAYRKPVNVPEWFPVELPVQKVPIHIVDRNRPFLENAMDAGDYIYIQFFSEIKNADELILEYSTDGGELWKKTADMEVCNLTTKDADIGPVDQEQDYWFRLVVVGGPMEGLSNILPYRSRISYINGGGDRDNDDRGDQGEVPPSGEIIPPPTDSSEDGGGDENAGNGEMSDRKNDLETGDEDKNLESAALVFGPGQGDKAEENSVNHTKVEKEENKDRKKEEKEEEVYRKTGGNEENTDGAAGEHEADSDGATDENKEVAGSGKQTAGEVQPGGNGRKFLLAAGVLLLGGGVVFGIFIYRKR